MKLRKMNHSVYKTQYHLVRPTKYRRKILVDWVESYLKIKLKEVCKYYPDWEFIEIGIDRDHIHLHMVIPPKYAVSDVVKTIKVNTSRALNEKFSFLERVYRWWNSVWSRWHFVSTVWIDEEAIRNYVKMQWREDKGQAELEF